jgi:hypothetical protein
MELFLNLVPAQRPFSYYPSIMAPLTGNHKPEIKKDSLDWPSLRSHNECMKNKNTLTAEEIIAIASKYESLCGKLYDTLNDLKELMGTPDYKTAVDTIYTEDPELEEAAVAVENACMSGEFSCFMEDLAEGWVRE